MGTMRIIVFALLSAVPGTILALLGYILIGRPETWENIQYAACYGPFFGCIGIGAWYGIKVNREEEMEG